MISSEFLFNILENLQAISYNRRYDRNSDKKTNTLITVLFSYFDAPNKNATVGTLLQDHVQNELLLSEFCSTILAILINNFTLENSNKNHIENEYA